MKKNRYKNQGNAKHPWWEEQVERWVFLLLRWQGRMAFKLQQKMNHLSPADQRRVWLFYVVGFSCCISVVLVKPFLKEDASNGLEHWVPMNARTWRAPLSLSQHTWILFPPLYSRFSAAFDDVVITPSSFPVYPLSRMKSNYQSVKQDSLCKP
jgi:hypothetical protein